MGGQPLASGAQQTPGLATAAKSHEGPGAGGLAGALGSSGMSAEASHAAAMDQILGSLGGAGTSAGASKGPAAVPRPSTLSSCAVGNQVDIGIDAFSAFGGGVKVCT